jgi:hypothetical protein
MKLPGPDGSLRRSGGPAIIGTGGTAMKALAIALALGVATLGASAHAADESRVNAATRQVESGARKIGDGKIGEGVKQTAKGIGNTVVEGAKFTGEKFKEAGKAAEPKARSAWQNTKEGALAFGQSVKNFFSRLFH